jgi:hypothetical protein
MVNKEFYASAKKELQESLKKARTQEEKDAAYDLFQTKVSSNVPHTLPMTPEDMSLGFESSGGRKDRLVEKFGDNIGYYQFEQRGPGKRR